ncbi:MAG: polyhydroxyalkanoic acid system family protein [Bacteroidetes bacterium]|nr:polyhydroxyalkanoic acid system family protein [Bacteroidota bacterium]MCX6300241.1 polyhydroxyalkanoic acid system family protein [Bacteroidota bacterium]
MPSIEMIIPHNLSKEEALKRIQGLLEKVKSEFSDSIKDLKESWQGNTGKFSFFVKGFSVSGTLTVENSLIELNGQIPFAAAFFKGKIKSTIEKEARELLA